MFSGYLYVMRYGNKRLERACERTVGESVTPVFDYYLETYPEEVIGLTEGKEYEVKNVRAELDKMEECWWQEVA